MKRLLSLFLLLTILLSTAFAESVFSNMTDEELIQAQQDLNEEIMKRGLLKKVKIPSGVYEVGVDIPAGKYVLSAADKVSIYGDLPTIHVFDSKYGYLNRNDASIRKYHRLLCETVQEKSSCMVTLEDGYYLYLLLSAFYIEPFNISVFD